jgi:hypothetical protein
VPSRRTSDYLVARNTPLWLHPDPTLKDNKKTAAIRESGRNEE